MLLSLALAVGGARSYNEPLAHELLYVSAASYCSEASILAWDCAVCGKVPGLSANRRLHEREPLREPRPRARARRRVRVRV